MYGFQYPHELLDTENICCLHEKDMMPKRKKGSKRYLSIDSGSIIACLRILLFVILLFMDIYSLIISQAHAEM